MTALLSDLGCVPLTVDLDRRDTGLSTASRARSLLSTVELYRRDLTIYLGADSGCLGRMESRRIRAVHFFRIERLLERAEHFIYRYAAGFEKIPGEKTGFHGFGRYGII